LLTIRTVIVHEVILASAADATATFAARRASLYALDALEGDAEFLTRTCDCRTHAKKSNKYVMSKDKLAGFAEEDEEILAVEGVLAQAEKESRSGSEEIDGAEI
jgi:endoribonuclease Dicer